MDLRLENLLFDCSLERPKRNIESSEKSKFPGMEQVKDALDQAYPNRVKLTGSKFTIADTNTDTNKKKTEHIIDTRYRDSKDPSFTKADKNAEVAIGIYKDKSDDSKYVIIKVLNPKSGGKYTVTKNEATNIWENLSESDAVQKIVDIMKAQVEG